MNNFDVLAQSERVHIANRKWWVDINTGEPIERNKAEQLMLVVTELSEAMEGARKNLMDDHLPHRKMEEVEIADALIRLLDYRWGHGVREEFPYQEAPNVPTMKVFGELLFWITDTVCRVLYAHGEINHNPLDHLDRCINQCFWYAQERGLDLLGAYEEKMAYNASRVDHTLEHRRSEHGKKI